MAADRSADALVELLKSKPVVDLGVIRRALGEVSHMTAFRYLRQVPDRRSYNQNGRYYCHHDPSRYDGFGLWSWQDIHFSVDGSLKKTVRRLVHEAEAGATQGQRGLLEALSGLHRKAAEAGWSAQEIVRASSMKGQARRRFRLEVTIYDPIGSSSARANSAG